MSSEIADLADAVTAEINANKDDLLLRPTAKRGYIPTYQLEDMDCVHVSVVPTVRNLLIAARSVSQRDLEISVAVQKRLPVVSNEKIDQLTELVQQIGNLFEGTMFPDLSATCIAVRNEPVYSWDHLQNFKQFTGILTLVFRKLVSI